jgi:hypothetical protein
MTEQEQIKKGFNSGYLIAKHKPKLSQKLQIGFVDKENSYAKAFLAGVKEYEREQFKFRGKNYNVQHLPNSSKQQTKDKDQNKDNRDR